MQTEGTSRAAFVVFVCLWLAAVFPGFLSIEGVRWPHDHDGFRDVALAQKAADGAWLADPYYKDEVAWYSPLVPWTVAVTSKLFGTTVPRAFVLAGAWLNALVPLAFFVCARALIGSWPALAATCGFLFLPGRRRPGQPPRIRRGSSHRSRCKQCSTAASRCGRLFS